MKITITDDALEANEKVIFVGVSIFASILALLVKMDCLPRVAEQRDAPVHDAIELLHQVREFSGGAAVTLTSDFIAKIDAVLRTASGG